MSATDEAIALARAAADAAAEKLARNIVIIDVSSELTVTDCFVIASAPNERQVAAISEEIEKQLSKQYSKPARKEGGRDSRWILLDYIDVVIHVQHEEERQFYGLDRLWNECPIISWEEKKPPTDSPDVIITHD